MGYQKLSKKIDHGKEKGKGEATSRNSTGEFSDWRKKRKKRGPIPEPLWDAAASLTDGFCINELSNTLHLNRSSLRDRIESIQNGPSEEPCRTTFIL